MIASKVTLETLQSAAAEVGVTIKARATNARGDRWRVKVNPGAKDATDTPAHGSDMRAPNGRRRTQYNKYQRKSAGYAERRVYAVCWHGFRDFFRAVYRREPGAVFATAMDTWRGAEDFEARFRFSGHKNIGSQACPTMAAEACFCPESGMAL